MDALSVAAGADQRLFAQHTELLRQGRLRHSQLGFKLADACLTLSEPAQQQESIRIRKRFQQTTSRVGGVAEFGEIDGVRCGHRGCPVLDPAPG